MALDCEEKLTLAKNTLQAVSAFISHASFPHIHTASLGLCWANIQLNKHLLFFVSGFCKQPLGTYLMYRQENQQEATINPATVGYFSNEFDSFSLL